MRIRRVTPLLAMAVAIPLCVPTSAAATAPTLTSTPTHAVAPTVVRTPLTGVDQRVLRTPASPSDPTPSGASPATSPSGPAAKGTSDPAVLTAPADTASFTAAGVTWDSAGGPAGVVVQMRIKEKGSWSAWRELGVEGGPDAGTAEASHAKGAVATEPFVSASADGVQVRVDTPQSKAPAGLQLLTVDAGTSAADAQLAAPRSAGDTSAARPTIITRSQWGADESLRDCSPTYSSTIRAGFVHHTVNSNTYQRSDSAALVRAIYAYHVKGNGWCDVGYQFLVDRFGQIFEGRAGGVDKPVIGAHAGGFNTDTFGVSGIGDFTTASPTDAMLSAMAQVIGWKLSLYGVDPLGRTSLTSAGGPATGYPAGTSVAVRTVSGHRDVDLTGCPGTALYSQIPSIATRARNYIATTGPRGLVLAPGQRLASPDGRYQLVMQTDGNLVVYGPRGAAWASGTSMPASTAVLQGDGNLVIYDLTDGSVLWTSNSSGLYPRLVMQNDGNLVIYSGATPVWDSRGNLGRPTVYPMNKRVFGSLQSGQAAYSPDRSFFVVMQTDGNLVEYDRTGRPRYASGTMSPGSRLDVQSDGNLVIYTAQNRPVWTSRTSGNPGAFPFIGNSGRLAVYTLNGVAKWIA